MNALCLVLPFPFPKTGFDYHQDLFGCMSSEEPTNFFGDEKYENDGLNLSMPPSCEVLLVEPQKGLIGKGFTNHVRQIESVKV